MMNKIREHRSKVGASQAAIAEAVGIAQSTLHLYEIGARPVPPLVKVDLADILGVAIADLFPPEPRP